VSDVLREGERRQSEHEVGDGDTNKSPDDLRAEIPWDLAPRQAALGGDGEGHGRVEVRAGDGTEGENQRDEDRPRGERVCQERNRDISDRKPLAHDSRADHSRKQQPGPDSFCDQTTAERR